ncbi:MAG: efflux RND transporter permease subunit [Patescibacteria group bacterium]
MHGISLNSIGKFGKFFIKNYQVSILVIVFLIIGGLAGYFQLPRQGMPEVTIPYSVITTIYPGASPQEVEESVTNKIETAVNDIDEIKVVESTSSEGVSSVVLEFNADVKMDKALDKVRRAVDGVNNLPEDTESPNVIEIEAESPDVILNVVGSDDKAELAKYAKIYKQEISQINGVAKAQVWGEVEEEILISLDTAKINALGLDFTTVSQIISGSNLNIPGGTLEAGDQTQPIQINSKYASLEELEQTPIGPYELQDIATITKKDKYENKYLPTGYVKDGKLMATDTVAVVSYADNNADVIEVNEEILAALDDIRVDHDIPDEIELITAYDVSAEISDLLGGLFTNGWQGLLIIVIVLFLFISFRSSIITAFIIPLVVLSTFLIFSFIDFSLNFLTLFSLILALGIIIDNAIVIIEGIQRNMRSGEDRLDAAIHAVSDLGPALLAATGTTVLVFIPMMFISGITGQFIKYIPYTVVAALVSSIILAFSITPFLGRFILSSGKKGQKNEIGKVTQKLIELFQVAVAFLLKGKYIIIGSFLLVGLLIGGSIFIGTQTEVYLWPEVDDASYLQMTVKYPSDKTDQFKNNKVKEIASSIEELFEEDDVIKNNLLNYAPLSFPMMDMGTGSDMYIFNIVNPDESKVKNPELITKFQNQLDKIEDAEIKITGFASGPPAAEYPVEVQIANNDFAVMEKAALELGDYLEDLEGVKKVDDGVSEGKKSQITIEIDENAYATAMLVRNIYNPTKVTELNEMDVKMILDSDKDLDSLKDLIGDSGEVKEEEVLKNINHYEGDRLVEVRVALEEEFKAVDINNKISEFFTDEKFEELNLDEGDITYRGDMESEEQAFDDFLMMMIISLIGIFALLAFQFKSFAQPFIIMLAIPLAIIGVFPLLYITGLQISFMVLLGLIVLMGIVVNNSIILIDRFNKLREVDELDLRGAIMEGINQRTRPIFATTLTTIAGILPLTIADFYWRGMGTTIIGGLVASAIFVLLIIPVVYYLYIASVVILKKKFGKKQ